MKYLSYRAINCYAFLLVVILIGTAGYLQIDRGIEPCPLCIIQRFLFAILGLMYLSVGIHQPYRKNAKIYGGFILLISLLGAAVALRQIWLQHLPAGTAPACGPGLYFMIRNMPIAEAIKSVFVGSGDCAVVSWKFLYLSMSEWSLIAFIFFAILALIQMLRRDVK